jgi:mRNA interferase RelE/StbE
MSYAVEFIESARKDLDSFDPSSRRIIERLIDRVAENPLPKNEGGYGEPLGHRHGKNLTGLCKIKLLKLGVRVVYRLVRTEENIMKIIVIAARADDAVYTMAAERTAHREKS